jgi:hypothetical protein
MDDWVCRHDSYENDGRTSSTASQKVADTSAT